MTEAEVLDVFEGIRVWQKGTRRAVHKPLLVLLMLGRLWRHLSATVSFAQIEPELKKLLERFGPTSAAVSRHYPFWHLKTDGIWQLNAPEPLLSRSPAATPTLTELRDPEVVGTFTPAVLNVLQQNPALISLVGKRIVEAHFPGSLQQDVLNAVGLDDTSVPLTGAGPRRRDPAFRDRVLLAYEYRCCVCGHDLRLDGQVVGLEAAHIQWFQAGGPDIEPNGLALCSLHHKLFDLGAFTVQANDYTMVISQHLTASAEVRQRMLAYHGAGLIRPQSARFLPTAEYLDWHKNQVFKSPARDL
jgi:putative restriction endonuclease